MSRRSFNTSGENKMSKVGATTLRISKQVVNRFDSKPDSKTQFNTLISDLKA